MSAITGLGKSSVSASQRSCRVNAKPMVLLKPKGRLFPASSKRGCGCICQASSQPDDGSDRPKHPELSESTVVPDALPVLGADGDWREFRARLIASENNKVAPAGDVNSAALSALASTSGTPKSSAKLGSLVWAHLVSQPEKGCLLLAHPLLFKSSQRYFDLGAILLVEHTPESSWGLILNRPSQYTLGELAAQTPDSPNAVAEFASCPLYIGGDVGDGTAHLLHCHANLEGAKEIVKGVYLGGTEAAKKAVAEGTAKLEDFRWFAMYAGWGPGQLAAECRRGVWFTAAASPEVVLTPPATETGVDTWHKVMQLCGGDCAELSQIVLEAQKRRLAAMKREITSPPTSETSSSLETASDTPPTNTPPEVSEDQTQTS